MRSQVHTIVVRVPDRVDSEIGSSSGDQESSRQSARKSREGWHVGILCPRRLLRTRVCKLVKMFKTVVQQMSHCGYVGGRSALLYLLLSARDILSGVMCTVQRIVVYIL